MVHRELLIATSTFFYVWASSPDRGTVFSCREYHGLRGDPQCLADSPQVVPARRRTSVTQDLTFPATSSRCCLKSASGPDARQGTFEFAETPGVCYRQTCPVPV